MPSKIKWSTLNTTFVLFNSTATTPTLKGLANTASVLSAEYDNTSAREQFGEFEITFKFLTAPTGSPYFEVWVLEALDGATYEDGDSATRPAKPATFAFPARAVATAQRLAISTIPLPPTKFKVMITNKSGVDLTSVDGDNGLTFKTFSPEAQ